MTGVIAALHGEARTARPLERNGWQVSVAGVGAENARKAAEVLVDSGVAGLLVWGTAAALIPGLRPGALNIPTEVLDTEGRRYPVSGEWHARLLTRSSCDVTVSTGPLVTVDEPVSDRRAKMALAHQTGAVAADMEAAAIARVAAERSVPFAVMRAVVDPVEQALPQVILDARPGRNFAFEVVWRVAARPRDLPRVLTLAQHMRAARRSLEASARQLADNPHDVAAG